MVPITPCLVSPLGQLIWWTGFIVDEDFIESDPHEVHKKIVPFPYSPRPAS